MPNQRRYEDIFGHVVPYIRIKDYVCSRAEIISFVLDSSGFLPTVKVHIASETKSLGRENMPVDGDRISVGIRQDRTTFKPIASDFIVTSIDMSPNRDNRAGKRYYEFIINGKLFIPNLDTGLAKFTYTGLAEDALKEACIRLGLGYVHSKNVKTLKKESWNCFDDPLAFIQEVTSHMWLGKDSFFDSWIDPRRNLTVVNVNDMLGRKLADDGEVDFTKYKSINGAIGEDGKYVNNDLMELKDTKFPKLYTNDPQFEDSMWYPIEYSYFNNSTNVSKEVGVQRDFEVYVQNNGVGQSEAESRHKISIGVWYNQEKLDAGYMIANGPTNYAKDFQMADNGSWKDQNTKKFSPVLYPIESDTDASTKDSDQSNAQTSGNFSKEYVIAPEHNKINLAELDKQGVIITTYGANLGIMRGEKVPCFLYNKSNEKWVSETRNTEDNSFEFDMVCSGWFYVKAVKLVYEPDFNPNNFITDWKTVVTLTRREWFPPESTSTKKEASEFGIYSVDIASGSSVESKVSDDQTRSSESSQPSDNKDLDTEKIELAPKSGDFEGDYLSEEQELAGMTDEMQSNIEDFSKTETASNIISSVDKLKAISVSQQEMIDSINKSISDSAFAGIEKGITIDISKEVAMLEATKSSKAAIDAKIASLESDVVPQAREAIKNGIALDETVVSSAKETIQNITNSSSSLLGVIGTTAGSVTSILSNLSLSGIEGISSSIASLKDNVTGKIESVSSSLKSSQETIDNIDTNVVSSNEGETSQTDALKEEDKEKEESFEELMAYDGDGMKHFMNKFIGTLNSEGIPYKALGKRRWAVDKEDNKVYGNAFVQREASELYKTIDSDGNLYWLSDFNSRHYYGEAIDIEPTSSFEDLLEKICLSDKVLDCMHKYGICIQLEVSKAGHSKGTHFHCSTERFNPQTKWWGIVNKRRVGTDMKTYTVIIQREYYESETKNDIVVA